jgi:hypothetical protein
MRRFESARAAGLCAVLCPVPLPATTMLCVWRRAKPETGRISLTAHNRQPSKMDSRTAEAQPDFWKILGSGSEVGQY